MVAVQMVFQIILLLCSLYAISVKAAGLAINSSCQASCGNVSIPYPFGIGAGCYADPWFEVFCNDSLGASPKPFLSRLNFKPFSVSLINLNREVLNISLGGTVRIKTIKYLTCGNGTMSEPYLNLAKSPFIFSQSENRFIAFGCNNFASMVSVDGSNPTGGSVIGGCLSICDNSTKVINASSCNGINCCQTTIPSDLVTFNTRMAPINEDPISNLQVCKSAFLVEEKWFQKRGSIIMLDFLEKEVVPVVLEWRLPYTSFSSLPTTNNTASCIINHDSNRNTTFTCSCKKGFEGNPYLDGGCQDINECERRPSPCFNESWGVSCKNTYGSFFCYSRLVDPPKPPARLATIGISSGLGVLVLLVGGWWSYKVIKKRRRVKQKNKFFKRNGGLLLQQQLSSHEVNVENTKLFSSKDLDKATDRFNVDRILGQGGQGTVYKGMLADGRIVAVKKSKVIDEGKLGEFINEVVILSQINHRNVVKLIGCCLETEVPLLVYEYVPNGTLSQYVNGQNKEFLLTWNMRLRIATEVAGALFYLHSAASTPIYHRDIKSTNILLDDKYIAKVADFGTSRSITIDQTHLTTLVHGTFGYLDPEYFQSSQFTEKSDVYSFGVVLAELLTGEKAISSTRTQESKSLATYFIKTVDENNLFDIIDSQVLKEGKKEEIIAVANLTKRCLDLNGKKRPTMKEVAIELEAVQMLQKAPKLQQNYEELEYVQAEMHRPLDVVAPSSISSSFVDAEPLLSSQSV